MSIIQAYKSDADGKIFEDKGKYQAHLRKLASARRAEKKVEQMEAERELFLDKMGQVKSLDELNQFIKDNWRWFWANGAQREFYMWSSNKGKTPDFHEYYNVSILDLHWKEDMSNSHSCPRKGVQNFDTRADYNKGRPTGYPGWIGRINIKVKLYRQVCNNLLQSNVNTILKNVLSVFGAKNNMELAQINDIGV